MSTARERYQNKAYSAPRDIRRTEHGKVDMAKPVRSGAGTITIHSHDTGTAPVGPVWTTAEMQRDYEVVGFAAPYVVVRRRADNVRGTLEFTHSPRVYFNFQAS